MKDCELCALCISSEGRGRFVKWDVDCLILGFFPHPLNPNICTRLWGYIEVLVNKLFETCKYFPRLSTAGLLPVICRWYLLLSLE